MRLVAEIRKRHWLFWLKWKVTFHLKMHKIGVDNVIVMFELPIELKLGHAIRLILVIVLVLTL